MYRGFGTLIWNCLKLSELAVIIDLRLCAFQNCRERSRSEQFAISCTWSSVVWLPPFGASAVNIMIVPFYRFGIREVNAVNKRCINAPEPNIEWTT